MGKQVKFETRKQGASAGDRVYGWLFVPSDPANPEAAEELHLALECVRQGHATPKTLKYAPAGAAADDEELLDDYDKQLQQAYAQAKEAGIGIHSGTPGVRNILQAGDDFAILSLVQASQKTRPRVTVVIEHVFDGSRFRCQVTDSDLPEYRHANFTLLLAGASCPRTANPRAEPPTPAEPFSEQAKQFSTARLLQRELPVSLLGTDKSGSAAVGTIHHPAGNIAVELLKHGLARMTDWTVRLMPTADVPALRFAENQAKRSLKGIWHSYAPPVLSSAAHCRGTVVEVQSGDTVLILPTGKEYTSEEVLLKISLASVRAPRVGSRTRPDEAYAHEAKERVRTCTVSKEVAVTIHYERDIPNPLTGGSEKRAFGTLSVGTKYPDLAETLIAEGLAVTQRHRDDDPTSPRYDELRAAEAVAKAAKKGLHKEQEYKRRALIDLTEPRKAKGYSGSLMRAGTVKAVVDYVFHGALFKLIVPSENCTIRFAPNYIRCPQPTAPRGGKPAEPFGDESKRQARLQVLQRNVEIVCSGVTNSGIITGTMYVGQGGQRRDYTTELLGAGLATLDQRKVEYGEVPKPLLDVVEKAKENKVGIWSVQKAVKEPAANSSKVVAKVKESVATIRLSEIRSGSHFFFHTVGDDAAKVMDDSMKLFTQNNGTAGAPCDIKVGKVVAALFDDGTGKSWYRAKIVERMGPSKVSVLFVDHGNLATVPVASHLRPLDMSLGTERIPPVAKEATLALTLTRSLEHDEGMDAARLLQSLCWGKDLQARVWAPDEKGRVAVIVNGKDGDDSSVNAQLISQGLARVAKSTEVLSSRMVDPNLVVKLAAVLAVAQDAARRARVGMWRYGDIGDEDEEE